MSASTLTRPFSFGSGESVIAGAAPSTGFGGAIYRNSYTSTGTGLVPAVSGIPNLSGIAADSSYYYWTQNDGRVYRKSKF
jgi:hypothetical protein